MKRCGYVALVGRPNAGKSTLLNSILGQKLAVVSRKPQTTRNRILGVHTLNDTQYLFLDTPGVHSFQRAYLNEAMNSVATQVMSEASVIVYLIDVNRGLEEEDFKIMARMESESGAPWVCLFSQSDKLSKADRKQVENENLEKFDSLICQPLWVGLKKRLIEPQPRIFSSKNQEMVKSLLGVLAPYLPESPFLFPEDEMTDRSGEFLASELIREQVFRCMGKEVPYETAVVVSQIDDRDEIMVCRGEIIVSRESHKPIVIGKKGQKIKEIGTLAKESMEKMYQKKIYLDLSVRVQRNWVNKKDHVEDLAHLLELSVD